MQGLNLAAVNAEVDRRGFVPVNEKMQVLDKGGKPLQSVWCIGDANGISLPSQGLILHNSLALGHLYILLCLRCSLVEILLVYSI